MAAIEKKETNKKNRFNKHLVPKETDTGREKPSKFQGGGADKQKKRGAGFEGKATGFLNKK